VVRDIVQAIGVAGTSNTLRTLEERIAPLNLDDSEDDERASKRSRSSPEVSDHEYNGDNLFSRSPTPDVNQSPEDCVSLGYEDEELDAMVCDAAGLINIGSVALPILMATATDQRLVTQLAIEPSNSKVQSCVDSLNKCAFNCANGVDAKCAKCKHSGPAPGSVRWLLDSGASSHFTHNLDDFLEYGDIKSPIVVKTASKPVHIKGKGAVLITHEVKYKGYTKERITRLYPVFYIPEITGRLLSVGELLQRGLRVYGDAQSLVLHRKGSPVPLIQGVPAFAGHTIYWLDSKIADTSAHATVYAVDYTLLHKRFGHPSKDVLRHAKSHTKGFPQSLDFPKEAPVCPGCAQGKMPSQSHSQSESRASAPFEKIHSDLKSFPVESYHRYKYFISFVDDYTSYAWIITLRTKAAAIFALKHFIALVKNQFGTTIKEWMSDAGGEYKSEVFLNTLKEQGIRILQSAPYTPKQNGRAERFMRTCMDKAQAMRLDACLPESWWEFAALHAVHVYNRSPMRRLQWRTPYEALHKAAPEVSHLRVFGCGAYVHIPEERRVNKLAPKSELMVYIGHTEGVKAFTFLRLKNNTVYIGATALFDENFFPKCETTKRRGVTRLDEPIEQHGPVPQPTPIVDDDGDTPHRPPPSRQTEDAQDPDGDLGHTSPTPAPVPEQEEVPADAPPPPPPPRRSGRDRTVPSRPGNVYGEHRHPVQQFQDVQRLRQWKNTVGDTRGRSLPSSSTRRRQVPGPSTGTPPRDSDTPLPPSRGSDDEVEDLIQSQLTQEGGVDFVRYLLAKAVPPDSDTLQTTPIREWTYKDILRLPEAQQKEWRTACHEELEALRKRNVFELVDLPKGRKLIKNRWVFDQKTDGRKKARLVAKGFSQIEGVDFNEIFSPVVRFESVRLMLALAALEQWHITGLDVKSAFLYGELDEELYMEQPEGFKRKGQEFKVLRLKRAIYGLKQAALAWWRALDKSMEAIGCTRLQSDSGLFVHKSKGSMIVVIVYVDDALFMGTDIALVNKLKNDFMRKWECRDLGDTKEFLRMRILKKNGNIYIDQTAYLEKVLQRFGMQNAKVAATPLPEGYHPMPHTGTVDKHLRTQYQQIIGSLMYIMLGTRPDIAFAVTKMAQHAASPSQDHLNRALHICRYLAGTADYALVYSGKTNKGLFACADSDWASNPVDRRSTTGYMVKLADGIFSWNSRAQRTVALSSTEAEYMSLSDTSRQLVWIKALLSELDIDMGPVPLCGDNQGSIFMASNPVQERRIKHIDIRYHYIREVVQRREVDLYFISGAENPADMFTKNLGRIKFTQFRGTLGLKIYSSRDTQDTATTVQ
jgi:transposase InsO family protein